MRVFHFAVGLTFAFQAVCSAVDDWPHWMGPGRDDVWRETGIVDRFPESGPKIVWRVPSGAGYAGPAISEDRVYLVERTEDGKKGIEVENNIRQAGEIPGGEKIRCLNLLNGEMLWQQSYDCPYRIAYPNGPRCTPAIDGDRVYVLGAMGMLTCLKTDDGKVVWQKDLMQEYNTQPPVWGFSSHPLVDGKQLIVPVGGKGSAIVAFDKLTGEELWRSFTTIDIAYAPLVIYDNGNHDDSQRQLLFWHGEGVTGFDPQTGKEFWNIKFPEEPNPSITTIATPVIVGDRVLISEFYKGSLLLQLDSDPPAAGELWRSHRTDPRNRESLNSMLMTPVVLEGHAYGIAYDSRGNGLFRCIELESGKQKWTQKDWLEEKPLMFASAFAVRNGDRHFLFTDTGELLIVKLSPEEMTVIDRTKILEPTTPARGRKVVWCHPAFSSGKMVVRNDSEIVCVDLKK